MPIINNRPPIDAKTTTTIGTAELLLTIIVELNEVWVEVGITVENSVNSVIVVVVGGSGGDDGVIVVDGTAIVVNVFEEEEEDEDDEDDEEEDDDNDVVVDDDDDNDAVVVVIIGVGETVTDVIVVIVVVVVGSVANFEFARNSSAFASNRAPSVERFQLPAPILDEIGKKFNLYL